MAEQSDDLNTPDSEGEDEGDIPTSETLRRAISDRYLTYALSTIMHRALPDARDGLKPVHRRILYAMRELRLTPDGRFRKSSKISGDVMGNYHPHGDGAIYDAMARLAQDFNVRYPLVDGQGNFGNVDGDNPAASRYTEARLTMAAEALMEGLNEDAVDFRDNYDGTLTEPEVLPAAFPNLLANGAAGIAVGMATNIPPHNISELCMAAIRLIRKPGTPDRKLLDFVSGPDFPTGGVLVEPHDSIADAYRTGRGSFRLRAKWKKENLGRGQWQVVITEIPYQVQKSRLIEKIADLINARKIPILADIRDESAEDIRLVLVPRTRMVDETVLMETLFRQSDLETRFSLNLNVLIDGRTPKVCSLKEVLQAFLCHRREVLVRRSRFRLGKIARRLEVLEGYIVAFLNLDRVIDIIRYDAMPHDALLAEHWGVKHRRAREENDYISPLSGGGAPSGELSGVQVDAILNMRLKSLRRLEETELRKERDDLLEERSGLHAVLTSEELQSDRIREQLEQLRKTFGREFDGDARRTLIKPAPEIGKVPPAAMIEPEPITVICSAMGWIRVMKGHIALDQGLRFRDGDGPRFIFHAQVTDRLLLFGSNGRFYTLSASLLPGGRGMGEPLRLMVDLPNEAKMVALFPHRSPRKLLIASSTGNGFAVDEAEAIARTRAGKQVLNVHGDVHASVCRPIQGDHVAVAGENRKVLVFPLSELPQMARGKGVRLQKYKDGGLSDVTTFVLAQGLRWLDPAGRTRTQADVAEWMGKRAGAGRMAPRGFPKDNRFTG
ncbi:MAG: DNA topoisomerase IV subunit A [Rhodobacteraceae bacterium]|nr:DNA topoisomerase IV subunit A [Paracoccaceae bacterium]